MTSAPGSVPATAPAQGTAVGYATTPLARTADAGFRIRLVAFIIDVIIVKVPVHFVGAMLGFGGLAIGGLSPDAVGRGMALALMIFGGGVLALLTVAGSWLYEALMLSSPYQATLGKMIFGMNVTDLYGNGISVARATGRHFAKYLSGIFTLCIGFMLVGFTKRKQGLHDMIADTLVRR